MIISIYSSSLSICVTKARSGLSTYCTADTGSPDFDKATSVGMVYYQPFYRNEMIVNYQLHVFGKNGKLYIIGNTAFGLKE